MPRGSRTKLGESVLVYGDWVGEHPAQVVLDDATCQPMKSTDGSLVRIHWDTRGDYDWVRPDQLHQVSSIDRRGRSTRRNNVNYNDGRFKTAEFRSKVAYSPPVARHQAHRVVHDAQNPNKTTAARRSSPEHKVKSSTHHAQSLLDGASSLAAAAASYRYASSSSSASESSSDLSAPAPPPPPAAYKLQSRKATSNPTTKKATNGQKQLSRKPPTESFRAAAQRRKWELAQKKRKQKEKPATKLQQSAPPAKIKISNKARRQRKRTILVEEPHFTNEDARMARSLFFQATSSSSSESSVTSSPGDHTQPPHSLKRPLLQQLSHCGTRSPVDTNVDNDSDNDVHRLLGGESAWKDDDNRGNGHATDMTETAEEDENPAMSPAGGMARRDTEHVASSTDTPSMDGRGADTDHGANKPAANRGSVNVAIDALIVDSCPPARQQWPRPQEDLGLSTGMVKNAPKNADQKNDAALSNALWAAERVPPPWVARSVTAASPTSDIGTTSNIRDAHDAVHTTMPTYKRTKMQARKSLTKF